MVVNDPLIVLYQPKISSVSVHTLMGIFVTSFAVEDSIESIDIDNNGFIYITSSRKFLLVF